MESQRIIKQLIPASGMSAVFKKDDGFRYEPVMLWALVEQTDDDGTYTFIESYTASGTDFMVPSEQHIGFEGYIPTGEKWDD